jgi:hypothetical protein
LRPFPRSLLAEYDAARVDDAWPKLIELSATLGDELQIIIAANDVPRAGTSPFRLTLSAEIGGSVKRICRDASLSPADVLDRVRRLARVTFGLIVESRVVHFAIRLGFRV